MRISINIFLGRGYGLSTDYRTLYFSEVYYTATRGGDFNDNRASCYPGALEIADSIDNDGDGEIDEGFSGTKYYIDRDQDGYGYSQLGRSGDEFSEFIIAEEPTINNSPLNANQILYIEGFN